MSKKKRSNGNGGTTRAAAAAHNVPGEAGAQPSASEQAKGVTLSSADPRPTDKARLDKLEKMVDQLAIKVGI
jgi:hypothetical protein